ncbi:5713_t:CDS:2, partial [Diversispora eburnea]
DKLELNNTQETLRVTEAWNISNDSNSEDSVKNSQDRYTSDSDMATISELADAIDDYLNIPGTNREILKNQIKRATGEIPEWDLQQTDLDNALNDLNLMTTAYNNERNTRKEDIHEFFTQLRAEIEGRGIDVADAVGGPPTGRDHAKGILRGSQGTIQLVVGHTVVQLDAQALREANGRAGTDIIPLRATYDPWNEDWSIADERPTNDAVNTHNANNSTPVVVVGIRFDQAVWLIKEKSPTVEEEMQALQYGTLTQGDSTIEEFATPEWLEKAEDIGKDMTFNELSKKLTKIELIRMARAKRNNIKSRESKQISSKSTASSNIVSQLPSQDFQKMFQDELAKRDAKYEADIAKRDAEMKKLKADFDTKMSQ